ncbi:MAG: PHB depolymerase family esterase [Pseudoxanthomonas sp.]
MTKLLSRLPAVGRKPSASTAGELETRIGKTIQDALAAAGLLERAPPAAPSPPAMRVPPLVAPRTPKERADSPEHAPATGVPLPGSFVEDSFTNPAGTRRYKLYVPASYTDESTVRYPLVLMLHGCTQSPDDFATGTRMNALADELGFLVAYPAQSPNANGSRCWNWFRPGDQARDAGEPALLAGLTRHLVEQHAVDPQRVYVAGLSAGAAMAVILGATYPELFAAVGAHSGLPYGAARDVPSAFAAMAGKQAPVTPSAHRSSEARAGVTPLIVFHGDADRTVAPANGEALVSQAMGAASALLPESQVTEKSQAGRSYTRSVYTTALGEPLVEYWQIHGAGHAWSGGASTGSYTDPQGPDASGEMMRFFLQARNA